MRFRWLLLLTGLFLAPLVSFAEGTGQVPSILNIRVEFIIFALTLIGVALFHKKTMYVALTGLVAVLIFKFVFDPSFNFVEHIVGSEHEEGEWRIRVDVRGDQYGLRAVPRPRIGTHKGAQIKG